MADEKEIIVDVKPKKEKIEGLDFDCPICGYSGQFSSNECPTCKRLGQVCPQCGNYLIIKFPLPEGPPPLAEVGVVTEEPLEPLFKLPEIPEAPPEPVITEKVPGSPKK